MASNTVSPTDRHANWTEAKTRFDSAKEQEDAYAGGDVTEFDRLCDTRFNAMLEVIATPAPDFASVIAKLELALSANTFGDVAEAFVGIIADDIRQLA